MWDTANVEFRGKLITLNGKLEKINVESQQFKLSLQEAREKKEEKIKFKKRKGRK